MLLANLRIRRFRFSLYDQSTAPLQLNVRMSKPDAMETTIHGCVTWSLTCSHLAVMRTAHHRFLLRKMNLSVGCHVFFNAGVLAKTGCDNSETTVSIRLTGCVSRTGNGMLPKRVMFGGLEGRNGYLGGHEQDSMGFSELRLSLFNLSTAKYERWRPRYRPRGSDTTKKHQSSTYSAGLLMRRIL